MQSREKTRDANSKSRDAQTLSTARSRFALTEKETGAPFKDVAFSGYFGSSDLEENFKDWLGQRWRNSITNSFHNVLYLRAFCYQIYTNVVKIK